MELLKAVSTFGKWFFGFTAVLFTLGVSAALHDDEIFPAIVMTVIAVVTLICMIVLDYYYRWLIKQ